VARLATAVEQEHRSGGRRSPGIPADAQILGNAVLDGFRGRRDGSGGHEELRSRPPRGGPGLIWRSRVPHYILALCLWLCGAGAAASEPLDEALYAKLLAQHTRESHDLAGTRVDYRGLEGSADWARLLRNLEATNPAALDGRAQQLAYWFNVYNILAIDVVVKGYPVESIRDVGSFLSPVWRREAGHLAGKPVTLHEIEHEILRPMGDPRIHVALVCASLSCPALRREPWTATRLDAQLEDSLRTWLADRRKGLALDRDEGRVRLSKIFDWFDEDFETAGGALAFAARYAPAEERAWIERHEGARVEYFDYDWNLNDLAAASPDG